MLYFCRQIYKHKKKYMRYGCLFLLFLLGGPWLSAQEEIFHVVEQMPRFPGCEDQGFPGEELHQCAQQKMLEFIYQNIVYPVKAREQGTEGTTVVRFVVEKDGSVSNAKVLREIGNGCGEEALRVVNLMNEKGVRWNPGMQNGKTVRVYFNLPVKYKLQDDTPPPPPPPYIILGNDTIYTEYDEAPVYGTGPEDLKEHLKNLQYPEGVDSCVAGSIVMQLFIGKNGELGIGDLYDYSNLGFNYQFEAISLMNATHLKWQAGKRNGEAVNCYTLIRVVFKPQSEECASAAIDYDAAYDAAAEAETLYAEEKTEEAIGKWTEALELMPGNAEFLLLRGQAYLESDQKEQACEDLLKAQEVVPLAAWLQRMLPLICQ